MGNVLIKLRAIKIWRSVISSNGKVSDSTWAFPSLRKLNSSASTGNRVIDELPSHVAQHSIYGVSKSRELERDARKLNKPGGSTEIEMQKRSNRILPSDSRDEIDIRRAQEKFRRRLSLMTADQAISAMSNGKPIDLAEFGFKPSHTGAEQIKQLKKLRDMPCPIAVKRSIRKQLLKQNIKVMGGFEGWKAQQKMKRKQCKIACKNFSYKLELWRSSFKEIESHFGSGVLSYFVFLKLLFQLDIAIFLLILIFVVIPQTILGDTEAVYDVPCVNNTVTIYDPVKWYGDNVTTCSESYIEYVTGISAVSNDSNAALTYIADFFQGTGFMENTVLFYGYYSSMALNVGFDFVKDYVSSYNLPLAYLTVTGGYFAISLLFMVYQSGQGFREYVLSEGSKFYQFSNKVFGSYDFTLTDLRNIKLKKKSIFTDIQHELHDQRDSHRRSQRTKSQLCGLWFKRIILNILVLGALAGAAYLIYYVTQISSEMINNWPEYENWHLAVQFLVEFLPSLTITVLNILIPTIFQKIVRFEDYKPVTEIMITLVRTVFLRLASLAILFATLYSTINCSTKDDACNVGTSPCQPLYCWETSIGQQLYKLVLTDFIVVVLVVLLAEFPRKLIVSKCDCKLATIIGYQQFVIPKNVLDLVYSQTLCWLGAFFSPLIPAICVLKFFLLFYIKKLSLLSNCVPNTRPYRASSSGSFFIIVLMISFIACCVPVIYVLTFMTPSRGCGPFRPYEVMFDVLPTTTCSWDDKFQEFLIVVTSETFSIPAIMVLCLTIYYLTVAKNAHKTNVKLLRDQLHMEGKDKQFLVAKITDLQKGGDGSSVVDQRRKVFRSASGSGATVEHQVSAISTDPSKIIFESSETVPPPATYDPGV